MSLRIFRVGTRAAVAIAPNFPAVLQCRGFSMEKKRKRHYRHQDNEEMQRYQEEVIEYNKEMKELRKKYAVEVAEIREKKAQEIQAAKLEDFRQQYLRAQVKAQIKEQNLKEHQRRIEEAYQKRLLVKAENREEAKKWEAMCDHRRDELIRIMTEESENWVAEDRIDEAADEFEDNFTRWDTYIKTLKKTPSRYVKYRWK